MQKKEIMNNFFGMYINDQLSLLFLFNKVLVDNEKEDLVKVLNSEFADYISTVSDLASNRDLYKELNSDQKRCVKYNVLLGFKDIIEEHYTCEESYYESIEKSLIKHSRAKDLDVKSEIKKYLEPTYVSNEDFLSFYNEFNSLSTKKQISTIREFIKTYKYCKIFNSKHSLAHPDELLSYYDSAIFDLLKTYSVNYQMLYPNERLEVIDLIIQNSIKTKEISAGERDIELMPDTGIASICNHINFMLNTIYKESIEGNAKHTYEEEPANIL